MVVALACVSFSRENLQLECTNFNLGFAVYYDFVYTTYLYAWS